MSNFYSSAGIALSGPGVDPLNDFGGEGDLLWSEGPGTPVGGPGLEQAPFVIAIRPWHQAADVVASTSAAPAHYVGYTLFENANGRWKISWTRNVANISGVELASFGTWVQAT